MLTDKELSQAVDFAIREDGRPLEQLCNDFNQLYLNDITVGKQKPLNKDFISRLRNNNFKVRTERILFFCEYIGVNLEERTPHFLVLKHQAKELECFINKNRNIAPDIMELRGFIADLLIKE